MSPSSENYVNIHLQTVTTTPLCRGSFALSILFKTNKKLKNGTKQKMHLRRGNFSTINL
jgi:hypothetical protein